MVKHLRKRQRGGLLTADATMDTYNQLIRSLMQTPSSLVYRYPVAWRCYYAVRGLVFEREWLVVNDMDGYVQAQGVESMGTIEEILP